MLWNENTVACTTFIAPLYVLSKMLSKKSERWRSVHPVVSRVVNFSVLNLSQRVKLLFFIQCCLALKSMGAN